MAFFSKSIVLSFALMHGGLG